MTTPPALSYACGTSTAPLLGETIGGNLERTVARQRDRPALVDCPTGRRWTEGGCAEQDQREEGRRPGRTEPRGGGVGGHVPR